MTFVRIHHVLLVGLCFGALATYACTLNPQPLPPGETMDGGTTNVGQGGQDAAAGFAGNDASDAQGGSEPETGTVLSTRMLAMPLWTAPAMHRPTLPRMARMTRQVVRGKVADDPGPCDPGGGRCLRSARRRVQSQSAAASTWRQARLIGGCSDRR
jgi:hypothetical protein